MPEDINISVAKIVATPSQSSWSQAYNAGKLFAVLSLQKETEETEEKDYLNILGKDLLETLEQEFFSLEVKDLESIKNSVETTIKKIPENVDCSFVIGAIVEYVLYVFIKGEGTTSLKRGGEFGIILESDKNELKASSGILKEADLVILQTKQFKDIISTNILISALDHQPPSDIAEALAPIIHRQEKGGAAAILIEFKKKEESLISSDTETAKQQTDTTSQPRDLKSLTNYFYPLADKLTFPKLKNLEHSRKMFLTIAAVVILILILTVIFATQAQNNAKIEAVFNQVYPQAQKKYDEGQSLLDLNKNLARDSFTQSLKILNENKSKFPKDSKQEKQILALLEKVNRELEANSPEKIAQNLDRSKISISVENGSGLEGTAGKASDFLKGKGYNIVSTANADNYNYKGTTIKVKSSTNAYLNLIKKDLSEKYTVNNTSFDLSQDFTADALVIIGK
ncbi:MAG: hypothetical protein A3H50_01025 [Candidatus Levybacteria bacterium RIFCSPLOWO2_02_FULL_37_10]|nr:MAG: hypothetical protein A2860_02945 [Candidatus Levybacteria bacterium RIFCSPHIGHO2_01_FULL_37_33]OGH15987.1 MAG: hypothetical protein A3C97_02070 [Candidatus Levybacteria bacterium RIFCSPHIGHO2_02_FULL_37_11]OGH29537.1 MAG: hypothetical protein A3F30_02440 [Candidatus Levybacteria bacterium RIFCSPHIGHO2_12_FULL_37_12]OGH43234.1 MAG: hypothetical protein A3H50_01025 [Candidatus Levybacteria bacterium RIFCSPLOWO2_02_FULL_37_10]